MEVDGDTDAAAEAFQDDHIEDESVVSPNFFVFVLFHVKPDFVENFRHYMSQFAIEARTQPGCLTYDLQAPFEEGCTSINGTAAVAERDANGRPKFKQFLLTEKWMNKRFKDMCLEQSFVLETANYSVNVQDMFLFPQLTMWQKVNGIHSEAIPVLYPHLQQIAANQGHNANGANNPMEHHAGFRPPTSKQCFLMSRQRTAKPASDPGVILQIMCRVAQLALESEPGCMSYDVLTSRGDEGKEDVLEIALWKTANDYLRHLDSPYVKQIEAVYACFKDNSTAKFWERLPGGLLEPHPRKLF
jgi:quinol monooxygenase YgiN